MPKTPPLKTAERPLHTPAVDRGDGPRRNVINESATQNESGARVGWLNRIFGYVYHVRLVGKRMKAWNKRVYYEISPPRGHPRRVPGDRVSLEVPSLLARAFEVIE